MEESRKGEEESDGKLKSEEGAGPNHSLNPPKLSSANQTVDRPRMFFGFPQEWAEAGHVFLTETSLELSSHVPQMLTCILH